jgi:SNF2 family DNA or RNA helicase
MEETQSEIIPLSLVLHGSWLDDGFFVWGESAEPAPKPRGRQPRVPPHPHAAPPERLRQALETLAPSGDWGDVPAVTRTILLPSTAGGPHLPPWLVPDAAADAGTEAMDGEVELYPSSWKVNGLALDILAALDLLVALPLHGAGARWWGADLRYWGLAAKLGLELLAHHKVLPGMAEDEGHYRAVWLPVMDDPHDRARLRALAQAMPPVCRALFAADDAQADQAPLPHTLLDSFIKQVTDRAVRDWGRAQLDRRRRPPQGVAGAWWSALWDEGGEIAVPLAQRRELARLFESWQQWMGQLRGAAETGFRLCFRLEPPEVAPETEQVVSPAWTLRYMLQASDDPSLLVPAEQVWSARGGTLRALNRKFEGAQERLLAGLGSAARLFPPIMTSLRTARPQACRLSVDEAYAFLREVGPLLEGSGFGVLVPPWWNKPGARLGVRAKLKADASIIGQGILNMNALVAFDWELALGDEPLSEEEFQRLAALKMPLVRVRGQWVMLQPEEIEAAIAFWEKKRQQDQATLRDALGMALGAEQEVGGLPLHSVQASGWLDDLLKQLQAGDRLQELPSPDDFVGVLRPYQTRGYSWLAFLRRWGLGACLADDMGLGKTIQAIALLLREREGAQDGLPPTLVVCPTSVVGNWRREIGRFAPRLRVMVHHGSDRARGKDFAASAQAHDVVISTYGLVRRDVDDMKQIAWSDVILDEAQNIKNPHAKQTRAVRGLEAANRIALTGTPVENRLSELWSIMQFLNPGLLGSQTGFRQAFALPIERYQDKDATERLKGLVGPFILRRVKTDPTVIQDLPEKLEMKVYCDLTAEQATLYEAVVKESLERIASEEEGVQRRGVVLGALMRLKQVCNHPAQFLGDGSALPGRSGKLDRLGEMLEEALSVGDRALVFTQFAEMGHMLRAYLQSLFGVEALFLHGGTPQKQRDRVVARFQSHDAPIFILSLKAGGTGLNLTVANHVFHFDRWWNPAVEDQATDRAFRIGQTRDVQVHKFLCAGTLEEHIDELIESKKALAKSVVGAGESWLTELSTDELRDVMQLRRD